MEDKIGLPLEDIHTSGDVPQCMVIQYPLPHKLIVSVLDREKLQGSLARFFAKLPVDKPVLRNNYFFQIVRPANDVLRINSIDPDELAW